MTFWQSAIVQLRQGNTLMLMYVVQSSGSSPGRKGFCMWVQAEGRMEGSIGGGIMEHKLVEWAKEHLKKSGAFAPVLKHQIHQSNIGENRSGMICSGEQTIAFYVLNQANLPILEAVGADESKWLCLSEKGLSVMDRAAAHADVISTDLQQWSVGVTMHQQPRLYIIGGGHVGLALSRQMKLLNFHITVFDDREGLSTMEQNTAADVKKVVDYHQISDEIPDHAYVVLVSFGYRTDELCMRQLIGRSFAYFGVMGSQQKMKKLMESLKQDFPQALLDRIYTPIGLPIASKTPEEIAVSIAAQIILVKNASLPQ